MPYVVSDRLIQLLLQLAVSIRHQLKSGRARAKERTSPMIDCAALLGSNEIRRHVLLGHWDGVEKPDIEQAQQASERVGLARVGCGREQEEMMSLACQRRRE